MDNNAFFGGMIFGIGISIVAAVAFLIGTRFTLERKHGKKDDGQLQVGGSAISEDSQHHTSTLGLHTTHRP